MKSLLAIALLTTSLSSLAASVKITSFHYIRNDGDRFHPLAEICGKVEDAISTPSFVRVVVDPKSKKPANYNVIAGEEGKFCLALITYYGQAEAGLLGSTKSVKAFAK